VALLAFIAAMTIVGAVDDGHRPGARPVRSYTLPVVLLAALLLSPDRLKLIPFAAFFTGVAARTPAPSVCATAFARREQRA